MHHIMISALKVVGFLVIYGILGWIFSWLVSFIMAKISKIRGTDKYFDAATDICPIFSQNDLAENILELMLWPVTSILLLVRFFHEVLKDSSKWSNREE